MTAGRRRTGAWLRATASAASVLLAACGGGSGGARLVAAPPLPESGRLIDLSAGADAPSADCATQCVAPAAGGGAGFVDAIDVSSLVGPAVVLDVRDEVAKDPDYAADLRALERFEAEHGVVPPGCVVLLLTGWDRWRSEPELYFHRDDSGELHYPGYSAELVEFLLGERDVKAFGIDAPALDQGLNTDGDALRRVAAAGRYGVTHLRGLERLPAAGATVVVAPVLASGAATAPARVLAVVPRA